MDNKLYRKVSATERFPQNEGYYVTNNGSRPFSTHINVWLKNDNDKPVQWWLEEINLDHIQDKRELTATFLVNSIRLLDEQGARHLVNELIERFHLLPTKEQINKVRDSYSWCHINPIFKDGWRFAVKYILESLKGVSNV